MRSTGVASTTALTLSALRNVVMPLKPSMKPSLRQNSARARELVKLWMTPLRFSELL